MKRLSALVCRSVPKEEMCLHKWIAQHSRILVRICAFFVGELISCTTKEVILYLLKDFGIQACVEQRDQPKIPQTLDPTRI